jgi:hypothetical protein
MSSRALSVKVSTVKVINALETKLVEMKENFANQDVKDQAFQIAYKEYQEQLTQYALTHIEKAANFRTNTRYNSTVNIDFDVPQDLEGYPAEPKKDWETIAEWQYKQTVEEIENAIRILKMTDEETVSTSTFRTVAQYL